jgi:hypothetical protein
MPHNNYYQTIVDRDATPAEAERLGRRAVEFMADEQVIADEPSPCVPGGRMGHRPAEAWQSAIVELDEYFLGLEFNGVEVVCGRQIFDAGQFASRPHCPECNKPRAADSAWQAALDGWRDGDASASLDCPHCASRAPIVDWRHDTPIGFGCLGLTFWNWPSLNREFIERLAGVLGHRVVLVEGKR